MFIFVWFSHMLLIFVDYKISNQANKQKAYHNNLSNWDNPATLVHKRKLSWRIAALDNVSYVSDMPIDFIHVKS